MLEDLEAEFASRSIDDVVMVAAAGAQLITTTRGSDMTKLTKVAAAQRGDVTFSVPWLSRSSIKTQLTAS